MNRLKDIFSDYNVRRYIILVGILIIMLIGFSARTEVYATLENFTNVTSKFAEIGLITSGMALIILTGNIDLSVGSVMCFSAYVCGMAMQGGKSIPLSIMAALFTGSLIGSINGVMIAKLKMQPVIVTLGSMTTMRGLSYAMKAGGPMRGFQDESFFNFGNAQFAGFIPYSFILLCVIFATFSILLKRTRVGMDLKAIGNNSSAAAYSGINVERYKICLFTLNGFISALAGIVILSRMHGIEASLGVGYEFDAITMCLLGGVSINGGKGTLCGAFLGIIVIGYLKSGMNLVHISAYYQSAILGMIILLSVVVGNIESGWNINRLFRRSKTPQ